MQSPCQVGMKNAGKYWKVFLLYFTNLETYCVLTPYPSFSTPKTNSPFWTQLLPKIAVWSLRLPYYSWFSQNFQLQACVKLQIAQKVVRYHCGRNFQILSKSYDAFYHPKTCSCPFVRYFRTLFWDDITIIWDENIVYFFNWEKKTVLDQ